LKNVWLLKTSAEGLRKKALGFLFLEGMKTNEVKIKNSVNEKSALKKGSVRHPGKYGCLPRQLFEVPYE
jgi:hypothetical protein